MGDVFKTIGRTAGDVGNAVGNFASSDIGRTGLGLLAGGPIGAILANQLPNIAGFLGGPATPDFTGAAREQAQLGQQAIDAQTQANRPTQSGPFSTTGFTIGPDGKPIQTTQLGAGLQPSSDLAQKQLADALRRGLPTGDEARQQAIDAAFGQSQSRLNPAFEQRERALRAQLTNQGLDPTSEAFQTELANFGRERTDAIQSALNSAIGQGTAAGESIFRQGLASQQAPIQTLQGLLGLTAQPGFERAGVAAPPDLLGALGLQSQADLERFKRHMELLTEGFKGASSIAGAL